MAVYVDKDLCKSCGLCIYYCPKNVFEITDDINKKGFNVAGAVRQQDCIKCKRCEIGCPDLAIRVE
jgi:2-oxoglutarate ferredoxin oxidoreductase subunit delta